MGIKGRRNTTDKPKRFTEPRLIRCNEDVLKIASEKDLYSGNILDINGLIKYFPNIEIEYKSMGAKSGSLQNVNDKWIITVNKDHHIKRQQFTIAHELGHYILHKDRHVDFEDTVFFRSNDMDSLEYAANDFAAKLLMPEDRVRNLIDNENVKNIGRLAECFGVSSAAMKYRVLSLGYKMKDNG